MTRLLCWLIPLLLAAPTFAGTVYVPFAAELELGGVTYETLVWLTNDDSADAATIEYLFLPTFSIGTDRDGLEPAEMVVAPGQTTILTIAGNRGMLEIFAPEEVNVHARLVPTGGPPEGQGVDVPIVSSDNLIPAGDMAHLLGWERRGAGTVAHTNFGLLNLGHQSANCLVDVLRDDGTTVVADVVLAINPLSHNQFNQALGIVGVDEVSDWRAVVTCDQEFYSYASIFYPGTSRLIFVGPAASGRSQLQRPPGGGTSSQFDYLSDLSIDDWNGLEIGPFIDSSGIDFHASGGPIGGHLPIKIQGVTYDKGISFYPKWSQTPYVEYRLNGQYALFTAIVRVDDSFNGDYEWAVVNESDGNWVRLERPDEGFRGPERTNPIRVGSAMTFRVKGDGDTLYQSPEIYAYGEPLVIEVDVQGVDVLRLQAHPDGTEQLDAPHRNGLAAARLVRRCPWLDLIDFADAKLFLVE